MIPWNRRSQWRGIRAQLPVECALSIAWKLRSPSRGIRKHAKAAPFKRNDAMLEALPAGLIAFPGSGISANLADKARKMGIPVWRFDPEGGA